MKFVRVALDAMGGDHAPAEMIKGAVDAVLDTITETLVKKEAVSFIGFGTFTTADRAARTAKVPGTDKTVNVPATTVAKFKVGKALKEAVAAK